MRIENQKVVTQAINTGRYKIEAGKVWLKWNNKWRELGNPCVVSNHRRDESRKTVKVWLHELQYIMDNGMYPENMRVTEELKLIPGEPVDRPYIPNSKFEADEIKMIRKLHASGYNQSQIAREMGRSRTSVRYIIQKIEAGQALKNEQPKRQIWA